MIKETQKDKIIEFDTITEYLAYLEYERELEEHTIPGTWEADKKHTKPELPTTESPTKEEELERTHYWLTPQQKNTIIQEIKKGTTNTEIAKQMKCTSQNIFYIRKKWLQDQEEKDETSPELPGLSAKQKIREYLKKHPNAKPKKIKQDLSLKINRMTVSDYKSEIKKEGQQKKNLKKQRYHKVTPQEKKVILKRVNHPSLRGRGLSREG